jgi:hypothetical protein
VELLNFVKKTYILRGPKKGIKIAFLKFSFPSLIFEA